MFPDGTARHLHELLREELAAARQQYESSRTEDSKREYLRVLKAFADLVVKGEIPRQLGP